MAKIQPRPEFGKPETGLVRHWFHTDAQMRRHYMSPADREIARQQMSARREQLRRIRRDRAELERRRAHHHGLCLECAAGLADVGAVSATPSTKPRLDRNEFACCICLAVLPAGPTVKSDWGPNRRIFRCRVLDPDPAPEVNA